MSGPPKEGTPNGVDRLAQIEQWFTGTYAHYLTGEESEAVLSLIESVKVARAALLESPCGREMAGFPKCGDIEADAHLGLCSRCSALARLDSGATEGDA